MSETSAQPLRLGGMALRNGLLIHGPTSWAAAARAADGSIEVASGPKPTFAPGISGRIPLLRGPLRLLEAFAVIPLARSRLPSARLPFEDVRVIGMGLAVAAASGALRRRGGSALREATAAVLGVLPAMVALRDSDLAAYHGVEHKAIGAYEQGRDDPAAVPKEHDRCGSNLVVPLLGLSVAGQVLLERLVSDPGRLSRAIAGIASTSVAVEIFAWAERHPDTALAHAVRRPGHEIQRRFATREPTPEQLEVGAAALAEILSAEQASVRPRPAT